MPGFLEKKDCYLCVLHFPLTSAWITPFSHPVTSYSVVFNGKYKSKCLSCKDGSQKIKITIDKDIITARIGGRIEKLHYEKDKICKYSLPICDAMESWEFIVSDSPINNEQFKTGYIQKKGVYFKISDIKEDIKRGGVWKYIDLDL